MTTGIDVEVVFALPQQCWRRRVTLAAGATAGDALRASGLDRVYAAHVSDGLPPLGVFGRKVSAETPVQAGDRVEIYRALTVDPREARRARVDARRQRRGSGAG